MQQHRPHWHMKMVPYSFSGSIPAKFEHKLRRHKQTFGKITTTVVLDKDENLLWLGLQWHRSCYSNEMKPLPIILAAIFLSGNCSSKIDHRSFFLQYGRLDVREVKTESVRVACENIRFSSLFADGDVSRGGTSATQLQKFHTDGSWGFKYKFVQFYVSSSRFW